MMERNKPNRKTLRHAAQNLRIKLKSSYSVQRGKCSYQNYTRLGLMQARYDYRQFLNESQYGNHDIFVDDIGTADLSISDETSDNSTYIVEQFSLGVTTPPPIRVVIDPCGFGFFICAKCAHSWSSAHADKDYWQKCRLCFTQVYATTLISRGLVTPRHTGPHKRHLCSKCMTGRFCNQ